MEKGKDREKWGDAVPFLFTSCLDALRYLNYSNLPASLEICMQVKKQQLETDMEQWTGSKLGKEYIKAVYCHPAYLTYTQSTSHKMLAG